LKIAFASGFSGGDGDREQEVSPKNKTARILYFIKRKVYKVDD
jgi:hypothetical protein